MKTRASSTKKRRDRNKQQKRKGNAKGTKEKDVEFIENYLEIVKAKEKETKYMILRKEEVQVKHEHMM